MAVSKIHITNFKSFKKLEVPLGNFSVLIGSNASGKSNFVQIFKFLSDMINEGLDNAISLQGGAEYFTSMGIGTSQDFSFTIGSDRRFMRVIQKEKTLIGMKVMETTYDLAIRFNKTGKEFEIVKEMLTLKSEIVEIERRGGREVREREIGKGEIKLFKEGKGIQVKLEFPADVPIKEQDLFPPFWRDVRGAGEYQEDIHVLRLAFILIPPIAEIFRGISIYDFDPKLPKRAVPITGKAELEENGSNLALVLKGIMKDEEKKRKFSNLVRELLPFVEDVGTEKFVDKSVLFKIKEAYYEEEYLPASLVSDGTITIIALIAALYFEKKSFIIIEEPERNIHPSLISKVMDMLKEASQKKQIIVTTHNPEIVKYADLEDILLISRDENGFSTVSKPGEKEEIKAFLRNEIGIEELYVQNLLGA